MSNPLVSVIITTCNRSELLKRAIDSVLNQTYPNIEIIIADDASTDDTQSVVKNYQSRYPNMIYFKHNKPMGANAARNNAIKASNGIFIAGLDDDDEFTTERIRLLVLNYDQKYSLITTNNIMLLFHRKKYLKNKEIISLHDMMFYNGVGNQGLFLKERILEVNMYDESLSACQDYDIWVRLIQKFGPAKSLNIYTQVIHASHEFDRISKPSRKKFLGYFNFYKKHKHLMNKDQKKTQLSMIHMNLNKKISFKKYLTLLNKRNAVRYSLYYIKKNYKEMCKKCLHIK